MRKIISSLLLLAVFGISGCRYSHVPKIGITAVCSVDNEYAKCIVRYGGEPVALPCTLDESAVDSLLLVLDGIVFTGGEDVDPIRYGAERSSKCGYSNGQRDSFELALLNEACRKGIPVLGICRGQQLINVAFGGTLFQDLPTEKPSEINHRAKHEIKLSIDSFLFGSAGDMMIVTSTHHQAVKDLGQGLKATAWAPDGIIESIDALPERPIIAVQFHPEMGVESGEEIQAVWESFFDLLDKAAAGELNSLQLPCR